MSVDTGANKHIALVKKWLVDKDSVSREELKANKDASYYATRAAQAASRAAYYHSYYAYATEYAEDAADWVKRYEDLMNE